MSIKALKSLIGQHDFTEESHVYEENSFGITRETAQLTELQFSITIEDLEYGYFEWYDIESGGEEWYCEGSLQFHNGMLVGYDGCFSLSPYILDFFEERGVDVSEVR